MKIRQITLITILAGAMLGCMQDYRTLPPEQHNVVKVESIKMNQNSLYLSIQQWFAQNLGKSNEALQIQDKEAGLIVGRMILSDGIKDSFGVSHDLQLSVKVEVKEDKYRITFSDFQFHYQGAKRFVSPGTEHDSAKASADRVAASILAHLNSLKVNKDF